MMTPGRSGSTDSELLGSDEVYVDMFNSASETIDSERDMRMLDDPSETKLPDVIRVATRHSGTSFQRLDPRRWRMLKLYSMGTFVNSMLSFSYSPLPQAADTVVGFHGAAVTMVQIYLFSYVLLSILSSCVVEIFGLGASIRLACWFQAIGACLRCAHSKPLSLLGQALAGASQGFFINTPSELTMIWFPVNERLFATNLSVNVNTLGISGAYFIILVMKSLQPRLDNTVILQRGLLISALSASVVAILCSIFLEDGPDILPSKAAALRNSRMTMNAAMMNQLDAPLLGVSRPSNHTSHRHAGPRVLMKRKWKLFSVKLHKMMEMFVIVTKNIGYSLVDLTWPKRSKVDNYLKSAMNMHDVSMESGYTMDRNHNESNQILTKHHDIPAFTAPAFLIEPSQGMPMEWRDSSGHPSIEIGRSPSVSPPVNHDNYLDPPLKFNASRLSPSESRLSPSEQTDGSSFNLCTSSRGSSIDSIPRITSTLAGRDLDETVRSVCSRRSYVHRRDVKGLMFGPNESTQTLVLSPKSRARGPVFKFVLPSWIVDGIPSEGFWMRIKRVRLGYLAVCICFASSESLINQFSCDVGIILGSRGFSDIYCLAFGSIFVVVSMIGSGVLGYWTTQRDMSKTIAMMTFLTSLSCLGMYALDSIGDQVNNPVSSASDEFFNGHSISIETDVQQTLVRWRRELFIFCMVMVGFLVGPIQGFCVELGAEVSFPFLSENVSSAVLQMVGNFISSVVMGCVSPYATSAKLGLMLALIPASCLIPFLVTKHPLRRLRLEYGLKVFGTNSLIRDGDERKSTGTRKFGGGW